MSWNKTSIASTASLNQIAQTFSLNSLCTSLQYSPFAQSLDLTVVAGLSSLLKSDENPVIHQLETHIANARQGRGARS